MGEAPPSAQARREMGAPDTMTKKIRLGIIFGGRSAEHEVSIQSARNIIAATNPEKFDIVPIAITKQGRWCLGTLPLKPNGHAAIESIPPGCVEVIPSACPDGAGK